MSRTSPLHPIRRLACVLAALAAIQLAAATPAAFARPAPPPHAPAALAAHPAPAPVHLPPLHPAGKSTHHFPAPLTSTPPRPTTCPAGKSPSSWPGPPSSPPWPCSPIRPRPHAGTAARPAHNLAVTTRPREAPGPQGQARPSRHPRDTNPPAPAGHAPRQAAKQVNGALLQISGTPLPGVVHDSSPTYRRRKIVRLPAHRPERPAGEQLARSGSARRRLRRSAILVGHACSRGLVSPADLDVPA